MSATLLDLRERKSFKDGVQIAWDSTSLSILKACPRKYQLSILEGWTPKGESPHLKFGIAFHEALEHLDHQRVSKENLDDDDLVGMLRRAMDSVGRRDAEGKWLGPWQSDHTSKNLESLIRSLVWYFDHYREDAFRVTRLDNGKAAVELSFRYELPFTLAGEPLLYCGHLDSIGEFAGQYYFLDRKTTGSSLSQRYFDGFSPSVQMTGYTLAAKLCFKVPALGGILDAMQVGVGFSRFGRHFVTRTDEQLDEWLATVQWDISNALELSGRESWPMNETACTMYGGCQFLGICSKTPSVRERFLESGFERRVWDPLVPRGTE